MNRRIVLIAAGIVAVCLCCVVAVAAIAAVGGLGAFGLTQPVADVGDKFLQSLKDGNYQAAYALMHPALQQKIGTAQDLRRMIESGRAQPSKWTFTTRDMESDTGHLEGSVTMQGGEGTVTLDLAKSGNEWRVLGFNLQPK